jgi:hypothetical protein
MILWVIALRYPFDLFASVPSHGKPSAGSPNHLDLSEGTGSAFHQSWRRRDPGGRTASVEEFSRKGPGTGQLLVQRDMRVVSLGT